MIYERSDLPAMGRSRDSCRDIEPEEEDDRRNPASMDMEMRHEEEVTRRNALSLHVPQDALKELISILVRQGSHCGCRWYPSPPRIHTYTTLHSPQPRPSRPMSPAR